ncbi:adipokinetic hormone/corazonin-related peptide receptor variant I-like [Bicyclus anynana]|uniref:Adipokinetic hormone/corazonin-related peptide receptor variant I-like n=1 Tax=Bicyclus anynana TaxID=110368 RepID=A0ABM3LTC6_BICAN|nr:adipokinetic hormone/corazonin-related peptide receptor variant I-like [Bicyclus anynana]
MNTTSKMENVSAEISNFNQNFWEYSSTDPNLRINDTVSNTVPNSDQGFVVAIYSVLLIVGAVGNVTVFVSLVRSRRRKSRVNLLMTHLVVADLIVVLIGIPLEIAWRTTNAWLAGNSACKVFLVLRPFGLYLSSNVLVCISLDRFFAVLYPLRLAVARNRSKTMLWFAWFIALLCSLPQSLIFRVKKHPKVPSFEQCVSFEAFANDQHEQAYNVLVLFAMYFFPLIVITVCYACIFWEINTNSKEISEKLSVPDVGRIQLRRSDQRPLARARRRTLRMTVTIVSVFALCWLPYATMTLWYMFHRQSAVLVSERIQNLFFIMAVSNSCMDPLVYGSYTLNRNIIKESLRKAFCVPSSGSCKKNGIISGPGNYSCKVPKPPVHTKKLYPNCKRQYNVNFQESTLIAASANSEPHSWSETKSQAPKLCEVFTVQSKVDV